MMRTPVLLLAATCTLALACDTNRGAAPPAPETAAPATAPSATTQETTASKREPVPLLKEKPVEPTTPPEPGQADAKVALARELIAINQSDDLSEKITLSLIGSFQKKSPSVKAATWSEISRILASENDSIAEAYVPIYTQNFSLQELRDLVGFYKSPTGKRFREVMPKVIADTQRLTQEWGQRRAKRIEILLQERGYFSNATIGGPVPPKDPAAALPTPSP